MNKWDKYFFDLATVVASNTKCLSRKVGAVLVDGKHIVSTGYNGPPAGCDHCGDPKYRSGLFASNPNISITETMKGDTDSSICPRRVMGFKSGEGLPYCIAAHAERNAIDIAALHGHPTKGTTLYLTCGIPCIECAKSIINAGIHEVVCTTSHDYESFGLTGRFILSQGGVRFRDYDI